MPDPIDIALGTSEDCNEDGIPDECESIRNVTLGTFHATIQTAIDYATHGNEIVVALEPTSKQSISSVKAFVYAAVTVPQKQSSMPPDCPRALLWRRTWKDLARYLTVSRLPVVRVCQKTVSVTGVVSMPTKHKCAL